MLVAFSLGFKQDFHLAHFLLISNLVFGFNFPWLIIKLSFGPLPVQGVVHARARVHGASVDAIASETQYNQYINIIHNCVLLLNQ